MSAITGICDFFAIAGSASIVLRRHGHERSGSRTRSAGDLLQRRVDVGGEVVVIDCTDTGAPPPRAPTHMICRLCRRFAGRRRGQDAQIDRGTRNLTGA
jgi:hypothetical protein